MPALDRVHDQIDDLRLRLGDQTAALWESRTIANLNDAEFRVFSQWGEDGIIQHLIRAAEVTTDSFIEIGVEGYREANTRFLLQHDNWRGLIIDAGTAHIRRVERSSLGWRHDITAVSSFVTKSNVNDLIRDAGFDGDVGLLSIDIDGNDYWVFEALEVIRPTIAVIEYNSVFGPTEAVTVPYDENFDYSVAHYSHLYYGASLQALSALASEKGYILVGSNSAGCNAFFVREDAAGLLQPSSPEDAWVRSRFRSSRGPRGELTYVRDHTARLQLIGHLPVVDVTTGSIKSISETFRL